MIKDVSRDSQSCPNAEQKRFWRLQIDGEFNNPSRSLYAGINVRSDSHFIHMHKKNYNKSLQDSQIANFCPVISRSSIVKTSTSISSV